jgi:hypothetical protein
MVVGMVARVEVVVVQCSVKPVVEEFHWTRMKKTCHNHTIASPEGQVMSSRKNHIPYVKQGSIEQDLVIPINNNNKKTPKESYKTKYVTIFIIRKKLIFSNQQHTSIKTW